MFYKHKTILDYKTCIGRWPIDRTWHASEFETLSAIERSGDLNPVQRSRLQELRSAGSFGSPGGIESPRGSYLTNSFGQQGQTFPQFTGVNPTVTSAFDPVAQAQKLLEFQQKANEPAIKTLQGEKTDLHTKYQTLLDSIKGQQTLAENRQTTITANELGQRGLLPSDTYGQQQIQNALLPVRTGFGGVLAQAGLGEQENLLNLATKIASLQAGNPESALSGALQFGNIQNQAQQFAQELALRRSQQESESAYRNAQIEALRHPVKERYINIGQGGALYDTQTGQIVYTNPKTFKGGGGGGGGAGGNVLMPPVSQPTKQLPPSYFKRTG